MLKMLFLLVGLLITPKQKTLDTEGFHLEWNHLNNKVFFSLTAPTNGWVAIGFTNGTSIVNTNLIQGCVKNGEVIIEDQYVTGIGKHPRVEELSIASRISQLDGKQNKMSTTISFAIEQEKLDDYHYDLSEGNEINIWLACSVSDDFDHHSRKRIMRTIKL